MRTRLALLIALPIFLQGCGIFRQSSESDPAQVQLVNQLLDSGSYQIEVNYMMPLRGGGRHVTGSYHVKVDGNTIDSHLPYLGVAHSVPYGGGKVLTFKDAIDRYEDLGWKKGQRTMILTTDNDEDTLVYTISISESGFADIRVNCRNRDDISFRGELVTPEPEARSE